jgi:hypothetical protein
VRSPLAGAMMRPHQDPLAAVDDTIMLLCVPRPLPRPAGERGAGGQVEQPPTTRHREPAAPPARLLSYAGTAAVPAPDRGRRRLVWFRLVISLHGTPMGHARVMQREAPRPASAQAQIRDGRSPDESKRPGWAHHGAVSPHSLRPCLGLLSDRAVFSPSPVLILLQ